MGVRSVKGVFTTVTYACGHTADFKGSPPRKGEVNTCLECFQEVLVVKSEVRRLERSPRSTGGNYDPDDWR